MFLPCSPLQHSSNNSTSNSRQQGDAAHAKLEQRRLQLKLEDAKNRTASDVDKTANAATQTPEQFDSTLKLAKLTRPRARN
jgi:hypothetical protein